jgi:hypothetical protein
VVVNNLGQLGFVPSSARYKRDIRDMGEASSGLMKLRLFSFHYKNDPEGIVQYGLVAEEVERVYPELVTYADGKVQTVRYSMLTPMLLNELQKQNAENSRQAEQIRHLSAQLAQEESLRKREIEALRNSFAERLTALERAMARNDRRKFADAFEQ